MRTFTSAVFVLLTFLAATTPKVLADKPPLAKADAATILSYMGYQNVTVAYITDGLANSKMVKAVAHRNGENRIIEKQLWHDDDLGWFFTEDNAQTQGVRIWSKAGFKEVSAAHDIVAERDRAEREVMDLFFKIRSGLPDGEKADFTKDQDVFLEAIKSMAGDAKKVTAACRARLGHLKKRYQVQ